MHTFWMKSDLAAKSLWKSAIGYGILSIGETIRFKGDDAMRKLEYTFKTDTLFKMLFVQYPELLKKLVADLLGIPLEGIGQFVIRNPEMPPENLGDKFCRLDINMGGWTASCAPWPSGAVAGCFLYLPWMRGIGQIIILT